MPNIARDPGDSTPMPEGAHIGVCYANYDVGTQYSEKFRKSARQIVLTWEYPEVRIDVEREGKMVSMPRVYSKRYKLSLNKKAGLRLLLEAWRGRGFTKELPSRDRWMPACWC